MKQYISTENFSKYFNFKNLNLYEINSTFKKYIKYINDNILENSIDYYLLTTLTSYNDSKFISDNKIHIYNDIDIITLLSYDISIVNSNGTREIESCSLTNSLYSVRENIVHNKSYEYTKRYAAYILFDVIKYISKKLDINFIIIDSPFSKGKKIVYIENNITKNIITILRNNNNINEWDEDEFEECAIIIYKYFLEYYKINYKQQNGIIEIRN